MRIEIWSDVVCPWCYIGKRRLEAALARFPHADDVQVVWRSFELDPTAPAVREVSNVERLAHKYGVSVEQAQAMLDRMTSVAEGEDLHFRLDIARSGNTFDAHRLLHLAAERGVQDDLKEALLAAYQTEGEAISNHEVLTKRAVGVGLEETEVRDVLAGDRYGVEVRRDEAEGEALGVSGVPFFVIDRRYAVSGAQDRDVLVKVLERAWSERSPLEVIAGDACGIDGCE
jgi:predicted DsbA family dithiol-disulfide isomerase